MSTDEELDSLIGPYVIGAVDEHEQRRIEEYLDDHGEAALEVSRLSEAFDEVLDAQAAAYEPPAHLWDQIAARLPEQAGTGDPVVIPPSPPIESSPPPDERSGDEHATEDGATEAGATDNVVPLEAGRSGRRRPAGSSRRLVLAVAAAAIVVLIASAGVLAGRVTRSASPTTDVAAAAAQAASSPDSLQMTLRSDDGTARAQVVMDGHGTAYLVPTDMPVLDAAHTYQLWDADSGQMISLGLVGDGAAPARLTVGSEARSLALSAEPATGSAVPTMKVAAGSLD